MPDPQRPNPDELLAQTDSSNPPPGKTLGRLKVFFGAAPGVGKTFAMLEEARAQAAEGVDVLIGYAEPHIRPETEALLLGLELLPYKLVEYRGATFKEFDVDAAMAKKPRVVCVDELAHTNAPGLRHQKRWQDVFDLLDAGIDVYATLNVQHLESVNDVVERITGVAVKETLPDEVLDRADEIELIDTTPEELTQRLREGKVYRPDVAERAIRQFFNKGNLTALRELSLRRTAERVDAQMREQRQRGKIRKTWAASERLLVCVGPSPLSARLIRSARRLASRLRAPWTAIYVESSASISGDSRDRINSHLSLAQQLGGEAITLTGEDVASVVTHYARERNVTKIVIGKPDMPRWRERLFGSLVEDIIRSSGDIDVYVIRGESGAIPTTVKTSKPKNDVWPGYCAAIVVTVVATGFGWVMHRVADLSDINVLMVYLLGVLGISWRFSRRASIVAAVLSVFVFDFVFVQPYWSFAVSDQEYIFTFLVMLATGLLISTLVQRTRRQAELFRRRQKATQAILDFTEEIASGGDADGVARIAAERISAMFNCDSAIMLRSDAVGLKIAGGHGQMFVDGEKEQAVAMWVIDHGDPAGAGTSTLPLALGAYLPIYGSGERVIGVLAIRPSDQNPLRDTDDLRLLETFALQAATAIERAQLTAESREAWQRVEQENVRNTLLSAVSHDLRTPLTAITGAASALSDSSIALPDTSRRELSDTILGESRRMEHIISNLLDISRLESDSVRLHRQPLHLGEMIHAVCARLSGRLAGRKVDIQIDPSLTEISADVVAIDQVVTNLIENALEHTPMASPIEVEVSQDSFVVTVSIRDHGPGVPDAEKRRVFDKFVRLSPETSRRGLGLGLAISKAIISAHGGTIEAANADGGGAVFRFTLPRSEIPQP